MIRGPTNQDVFLGDIHGEVKVLGQLDKKETGNMNPVHHRSRVTEEAQSPVDAMYRLSWESGKASKDLWNDCPAVAREREEVLGRRFPKMLSKFPKMLSKFLRIPQTAKLVGGPVGKVNICKLFIDQ